MTTVLGPVRFSFVNIFQPKMINDSGDPKYSLTILIPKDDQELVQKVNAAIDKEKQRAVTETFNGQMPKKVKTTLHDGDGTRPNGEEFGPECKGHYVMTCTANAQYPPQVIAGIDKHDATSDEVKAGDYGYVSVNFKAYNRNGNKGIGSYLNNVWKTRNGDPLGSVKRSAQDDFKDLHLKASDFDAISIDPITGERITLPQDDSLPF